MTVRSISSFVFLVIWSGLLQPAVAQEYITKPKQSAAFAEVVEDPALPRVLIIGDSISIGYTPPLREILMGKVNVHRIPVNGGPTTRGVQNIDSWLGDTKWEQFANAFTGKGIRSGPIEYFPTGHMRDALKWLKS